LGIYSILQIATANSNWKGHSEKNRFCLQKKNEDPLAAANDFFPLLQLEQQQQNNERGIWDK
jgi:hypothetical protein